MNDAQKQTASTQAHPMKHVVIVRPRKSGGKDRIFKGCSPEGN